MSFLELQSSVHFAMSRAIPSACALAALLALAASEPSPKPEAEAEPIQVDDLGVSAKPRDKAN